MIFSWILGILIFSYAAYIFVQHIRKGKEGECAKCSRKENCGTLNASNPNGSCKEN